jgi:O-antigen/teichoic acid export membrane protein
VLSALGSVFAWLGAPLLLQVVFGRALAGADDVLRILTPAFPCVFINVILFYVFVAAGCRKAYLATLSASLAVGCVAGLLLAPRYGAAGSAIAAVAREAATSGLFLYFLWRERIAPEISRGILKGFAAVAGVLALIGLIAGPLIPWNMWPLAWCVMTFAGVFAFSGLPRREHILPLVEEEP